VSREYKITPISLELFNTSTSTLGTWFFGDAGSWWEQKNLVQSFTVASASSLTGMRQGIFLSPPNPNVGTTT